MLTLGSSVFDTWPYEPKSHRNCWSHSYASNWSIASPSSILLGAPDFLTAALATVPTSWVGTIALRPCVCPGHSVPKVEVARDGFHGDYMRGAQGRPCAGRRTKRPSASRSDSRDIREHAQIQNRNCGAPVALLPQGRLARSCLGRCRETVDDQAVWLVFGTSLNGTAPILCRYNGWRESADGSGYFCVRRRRPRCRN